MGIINENIYFFASGALLIPYISNFANTEILKTGNRGILFATLVFASHPCKWLKDMFGK